MITSNIVNNPTEPLSPRISGTLLRSVFSVARLFPGTARIPAVVRFGDRHILICLEEGCALHVEEFPRGIQYLDGTFLGLLDQPSSC